MPLAVADALISCQTLMAVCGEQARGRAAGLSAFKIVRIQLSPIHAQVWNLHGGRE